MPITRRGFLTCVGAGAFAPALGPGAAVNAGAARRRDAEAAIATGGAVNRLAAWPALERRLHEEAGKRPQSLTRGAGGLRLEPRHGAYAADLARPNDVEAGGASPRLIAPDGLLVFAVDVAQPVYVRAEMELEPHASDLRPGLRAYVLRGSALVGAPMLRASAPWGTDKVISPAPDVSGAAPPARVVTAPFLLPAGRHHLTVAGPHARPAGTLRSLTLAVEGRPVEAPRSVFALISDTHVCEPGQRPEWMNVKMSGDSAAAFTAELRALAAEGVRFVQHGGDMTEGATREHFRVFASALGDQPLPVYGCIGNHDAYHASSRPDAMALAARCFPGGAFDYSYRQGGLRFVVLDEDIAKPARREAKREWLRSTLKEDATTPTVVVWHYAPYNRGGVSNCGYKVEDWSEKGKEAVLDVVRAAPNVVATLNGHDHWDEVNRLGGLTHVQNAAFVEWPNSYRVFRVYGDRVEWEVRQVANRGFVRESFAPRKGLSWMISTGPDADLCGSFPLRRPKTAA